MMKFGDRRAVFTTALMALLLGASALAGLYVQSKHEWATNRLQEIEQRHARLSGLELRAGELEQAEARARVKLAALVYPTTQDISQAGNDAQTRVRDTVTRAGLQVMSSQVLAPKVDRAFDRIPMSVRLEGELPALQTALAVLEDLSPAVYVESMNVQTIGAVKAELPQRLGIQFSLYVLRARE